MKVFLLGYMASGKSTIGRELARKMNFKFIDLDAFIEDNEKATITQIFEERGEIYFRQKESEYLQTILQMNANLIVALGGGTPCYGNSMDVLSQSIETTTIYLRANIHTIVKRLKQETSRRPLVSHIESDEALTEFVGKHLFERAFYYNKADVKILIDEKSIQEITEAITIKLI